MTDNELKAGERYLEGTGSSVTEGQERVLVGQTGDTAAAAERHLTADTAAQDTQLTQTNKLLASDTDRLVLYEERAKVDVVRESQGAVTVRKVVTEREEMIPVTLRRECLEIVVQPGAGCVRLDGKDLEAGQTYQVELSNERATVQKEVVAVSEVSFEKRAVTEEVKQAVTLRREVLDVQDPQNLIANRAEIEGEQL